MNNFKTDEGIDLLYVLKVLKKGWKLIFSLFIILFAAAYAFSAFFITPKYASYIKMYVTNTSQSTVNGDINYNDISAAQQLADTYIVILKDSNVMEQVCAKLHSDITASQLSSMVTFTTEEETEVIRITAMTAEPELSAEICNVYADIAPSVLERVVKAGSVETIGDAKAAKSPSYPNKLGNAAIGGALGIVLAVVIVFLKDFLDNTVQNENELKDKLNISLWAAIPSSYRKKKRNRKSFDVTTELRKSILNSKTSFAINEAYKTARTSMSFAITESPIKTVVFSSSEPNAGKSTTTANMAITMSKTNAKVLIIDADLRKPMQHELFKMDNQKGLSGILAGHYPVSECIKEIAKNLYLMPSGIIPPNPSELLASHNMNRLMKELRDIYDYIFIDAPPVNVVTDAAIIAPKTDGMVFVIREGQSEYPEIFKSINSVQLVDGKILGVILTDVKDSKSFGSMRYKAYDYKYGYRHANESGSKNEKE